VFEAQDMAAMEAEIDETEGRRPVNTGLVTSGVLAALLLIFVAFVSQFPEIRSVEAERVATR
jgi:hypothetical protein